MDWNEIKTEYISTEIGYRDLAKKHGVSFSTLQRRARKENWAGLRRQVCDDTVTAVTTAVINSNVDRALRVQNVADQLLDKIELTIDNIDGRKSARSVKDVADALKNVKDIMNIKSEADMQEQEARIAKLRREAEGSTDKPVVVRFEGCDDDWCS